MTLLYPLRILLKLYPFPETINMPLPTDGLRCWYDANDLSTITKDGSNKVSQWNDKSGNGRNVGQGTAGNQPLYVTGYMGGASLPAILFDGVDDWMQWNGNLVGTSVVTVMSVVNVRRVQALNWVEVICANKLTGNNPGFAQAAGNGYTHTLYPFIDSECWNGSAMLQGSDYIQTQPVRGDYRLVQYDTAVMISKIPSSTDPGVAFHIGTFYGGGYFGNVGIGELAVWNKHLTDAEMLQVDDYLRAKYSIGKITLKQVPGGTSDAEEDVSTTVVNTNSAGLQMQYTGSTKQLIGIRFTGVNVPKNAQIAKAYLHWIARAASGANPTLTYSYHDSDDAPAFAASNANISARSLGATTVSQTITEAWVVGREYISADIGTIIQAIVNRSGWVEGNALAIIISGTTDGANPQRDAYSYDGSSVEAPYLMIEYKQYPPVRHIKNYRPRRISV